VNYGRNGFQEAHAKTRDFRLIVSKQVSDLITYQERGFSAAKTTPHGSFFGVNIMKQFKYYQHNLLRLTKLQNLTSFDPKRKNSSSISTSITTHNFSSKTIPKFHFYHLKSIFFLREFVDCFKV